jgi:hypothetical protein
MAAITIISGCLGTGKTVLSKTLAHAEPAGLHFVTDTFYEFPAHALDPTTHEAHGQNATIMTAIGRAAARTPNEVRAEFIQRRRRQEFVLDIRGWAG